MLEALAAVGSVTGFGVAAWPAARRHVFAAAMVAGGVSIAVSAVALVGAGRTSGWLSLVESLGLIGLVFLALRRARARLGVLAAAVTTAAVLAIIPSHVTAEDSVLANAAGMAVWGLGAALAAAAARYLDALDQRRARSVAEARREQRLSLARDLHDFVAHDVSAIVVQAQAARLVGEREPGAAMAALERIETDGLHALAAMDRAVEALRDASKPASAAHGLDGLRELAGRFESSGSLRVELRLDDAVAARAPRAVQSTAYRIVSEGLTNVRRHARRATTVRVVAGPSRLGAEPALAVSVTDDGEAAVGSLGRNGGGFGLAGLRELVAALGGTLEAGPDGDAGWRLMALLPLRDPAVGA